MKSRLLRARPNRTGRVLLRRIYTDAAAPRDAAPHVKPTVRLKPTACGAPTPLDVSAAGIVVAELDGRA